VLAPSHPLKALEKLGSFCQKSNYKQVVIHRIGYFGLWLLLVRNLLQLAFRATPTHLDGAALEYRIAEALQQGLPDDRLVGRGHRRTAA
jgi:hypothetical protein